MAFSIKRLRTHASIGLANALAIFITIYSGWNLTEATLAYLGEFVMLALVVYARVFAAKQLSGGGAGSSNTSARAPMTSSSRTVA
jgi:hypothetical protein